METKVKYVPLGWNPKTKAQRVYTNKSDNEINTTVTDPKLVNVHYNTEHINKIIEKLGNYKKVIDHKMKLIGYNVLSNEKDTVTNEFKYFSLCFFVDGLFTKDAIVNKPINEVIYKRVRKSDPPNPDTFEEYVEFNYRSPSKTTKHVYETTPNETTLDNLYTFVDGLVKFKYGEI